MISTGVISVPRKFENLKFLVANFTFDKINGKLASHVLPGGQGYIVADFVKNKANGVPHGANGQINLIDGVSNGALDIPNALIEIEQGAAESDWPGLILGSFAAGGFSADNHFYKFRTVDKDSTSLIVEFAVADDAGLKGMADVAKVFGL